MDIGTTVKANSILTGTIVIEDGEQRASLTRVASLQLIDVANDKTLITVLFDSEKENSISDIAKRFGDILKQTME